MSIRLVQSRLGGSLGALPAPGCGARLSPTAPFPDPFQPSRVEVAPAEHAKLVIEEAGAAPLAALLQHPELADPAPVVLVLSGGNLDPGRLERIRERAGRG